VYDEEPFVFKKVCKLHIEASVCLRYSQWCGVI
jgi:hypothetical protein